MTFSILAHDPETGAIGGAAATGSLCVGGWVLRGRLGAGMSASQGAAPSTFWGEDVLTKMQAGTEVAQAVKAITMADPGRDYRQLAALSPFGAAAVFNGAKNTPAMASVVFENGVVAGNMLSNPSVITEMEAAFQRSSGPLDERLLAALNAAERAGSDSRGLLSAALLYLSPTAAPLSLRVDHHANDPVGALHHLHEKATTGAYAKWASQVPNPLEKDRILDE